MKTKKQFNIEEEILSFILTGNSVEALKLISQSGLFLKSEFGKISSSLFGIDYEKLNKSFPHSKKSLDKIFEINAVFTLNQKLKTRQSEIISELDAAKLVKGECLELLLFFSHLSTVNFFANTLSTSGRECLEATQFIYERLRYGGTTSLNIENCNRLLILWNITTDIIKNRINFELIVDNNYSLVENGEGDYSVEPNNNGAIHTLRRELIQKSIEKESRFEIAEEDLKNEDYIKHIDKLYKSNKGLPGVIHGSGVSVNEMTPGLTALQIDDNSLDKIDSSDPIEQKQALEKVMCLFYQACFHKTTRDIIKSVYNPALKINVKYPIEVSNGVAFTMYELFLVMAAILSKLSLIHNYGIFLIQTLENFKDFRKERKPSISEFEFQNNCLAGLLQLYIKNKESLLSEAIINCTEDELVKTLRNIEDFKHRKEEDLKSVLEFLSNKHQDLPYNLLYKENGKYYSYAFRNQLNDYPEIFYNYYLTSKMFSPNTLKGEESNSHKRESQVCSYLNELFEPITKYRIANLTFPKSLFGEFYGEKDFFAYSEKENIIFYAEVKLSNVFPRKTIRKKEWIENYVMKKGLKQIKNTLSILSLKEGVDFLGDAIGIKNLSSNKPKIFSFLISDCYFCDHMKVSLPNQSTFTVLNIFEIENVIKGNVVNPNQKINTQPIKNDELGRLIEILNGNEFWKFIEELSTKPKESFELISFNQSTLLRTFV